MKVCVFLLIIITNGILLLLPALGNFGNRHFNKWFQVEIRDIEQCWVQPPAVYCRRKCTKTRSCLYLNHTCCWTFCGEICLDNRLQGYPWPPAQGANKVDVR
ncbi:protein WFDC9 [Suncus etruscus]|uniref:protein WFDC9 n=1 Tax=Suncus etruscus TaxID=109475 RepID=UPI00210F33A2|nr:protein WFDC9 [Suncus etruscus]